MELFDIVRSVIFIVILITVTIIVISKSEKSSIGFRVVIMLLIIRLIYSILRYWFNLPPDMPDIEFYEEQINTFISNHMRLEVINPRFDVRNYIAFHGIIRYFFGNTWLVTVVLNSILGTYAIYNASNIAYEISGKKAKYATYLFLSLEPTIFLYTNSHLREAVVLFTITLAMVNLVKYIKYTNNKYIELYFLISIISGLFRAVNIFILIAIGLMSILLVRNKKQLGFKKVITIILASLLGLLLLRVLENVLGFSVDIKYINENLNRDMIGGGTMPYLVGERYDSWTHLIISIPKRFLYFVLHPFPWDLSNVKHIIPFISSLYNVVFIIMLIIFSRIKLKNCINYSLIKKVMAILLVALIIYAVVKSESASRHRLQFIWLLPVITSSIIFSESIGDKENKK